MKYVLLRDDRVVGLYDSSPAAIEASDEIRKREERWFSKDLFPPFHVLMNAKWRIEAIDEK